jgi:hypothetical protein
VRDRSISTNVGVHNNLSIKFKLYKIIVFPFKVRNIYTETFKLSFKTVANRLQPVQPARLNGSFN